MVASVGHGLRLDVVRGAPDATRLSAWASLVTAAREPSGFSLPEFAIPHFELDRDASLAAVMGEQGSLFSLPYCPGRLHHASLASDLIAAGLPHIDGKCLPLAVNAFLRNLDRPFLFKSIPVESAFFRELQMASPRFHVLRRWERAALRVTGSYEVWLARNFDHKRRKELKRLRNRLAEQGTVEMRSISSGDDVTSFVATFLELEAKGWKGKRGTALQLQAKQARLFQQVCEGLHANDRLRFWSLMLDGRPVAALFGMVEGDQAWLVKTAYDESFARFSPGVLLLMEVTEQLFADGKVRLADSCAMPGHPMIERIWRDRLDFADVLVAPAQVSALAFKSVRTGLDLHSNARGLAKKLFYGLTGRKLS